MLTTVWLDHCFVFNLCVKPNALDVIAQLSEYQPTAPWIRRNVVDKHQRTSTKKNLGIENKICIKENTCEQSISFIIKEV